MVKKKPRTRVRYVALLPESSAPRARRSFSPPQVTRAANVIDESKRYALPSGRSCPHPSSHACIVRQTGALLSRPSITRSPLCHFHSHPPPSAPLQCIARKVPELCKAYTPGKTDQDIHARLARLEQIVEMALPQFSSGSNPGSPAVNGNGNMSRGESDSMSPIDDDDDASQAEEGDVGGGSFESGKWFGNTVSGSVAPATMLEQVCIFPSVFQFTSH